MSPGVVYAVCSCDGKPESRSESLVPQCALYVCGMRMNRRRKCDAQNQLDEEVLMGELDSDDFIETLDDKRKLLRCRPIELRADALNGQGSNLADLDPRTFIQLRRL